MRFKKALGKATEVVAGNMAKLAEGAQKIKNLNKTKKSTPIDAAKDTETTAGKKFEEIFSSTRKAISGRKAYLASGLAIALVCGVSFGVMGNLDKPVAASKSEVQAAQVNGGENKIESVMYSTDKALIKNVILSEDEVCDMSNPGTFGFSVRVNGENYGFLSDEAQAAKVVESILKEYSNPSSEKGKVENAYFKERVEVRRVFKPLGQGDGYSDVESVLRSLKSGKSGSQVHVVKDGETFWDISVANKMSVEELIAANPKLDSESIKPGDKVSLTVSVPIVNVVAIESATITEVIEKDVDYRDDKSLLKGKTKIVEKGKDGKKEVQAKLTKVNGKVVDKDVISEKVISKPVAKVVAKGVKKPAYASGSATGHFIRPMSRGYVSSGYGYRWGGFHAAIDIASDIGTPVKASDGGTVVSANYDGPYGYAVVISHSNGYKTRYAHLSTMYVRPGQSVSKGQVIAASGATGNVTGPHLHFEIMKNGAFLNPSNYIGR